MTGKEGASERARGATAAAAVMLLYKRGAGPKFVRTEGGRGGGRDDGGAEGEEAGEEGGNCRRRVRGARRLRGEPGRLWLVSAVAVTGATRSGARRPARPAQQYCQTSFPPQKKGFLEGVPRDWQP